MTTQKIIIKTQSIVNPLKTYYFIFVAAGFLLALDASLWARSVYQKQIDNSEVEVELDAYYSDIDYYIPLTNSPIPCLNENNELEVYKRLLMHPIPRFIVAEASVNPAPCLGVFIKKNEQDLYNRANLTPNFNLIQGITAGFDEPWAGSVFLGNVVSYSPPGMKECSGKGYIGALLSGGNYHIKDNELIDDHWFETELKLKGDKVSAENKITWSFRMGAKFHENPYIKDVLYFSIRRDRIDYGDFSFGLLKNSGIEYTFDVDNDSGKIIRHYFRIGKKVPLGKYRAALSVNTGFIWEGADMYTGPLARPGNGSLFQIILQPNLEF